MGFDDVTSFCIPGLPRLDRTDVLDCIGETNLDFRVRVLVTIAGSGLRVFVELNTKELVFFFTISADLYH